MRQHVDSPSHIEQTGGWAPQQVRQAPTACMQTRCGCWPDCSGAQPAVPLIHFSVGVGCHWPPTSGLSCATEPSRCDLRCISVVEYLSLELAAKRQVHGCGGKQPVHWAGAFACTNRLLQVHDWGGTQAYGQSCSRTAGALNLHPEAFYLHCRCMAGVARSPVARAAAANLVVTTLAILINNYRGASSATLTSSMATIAVEGVATLGGEPDETVQRWQPHGVCSPLHAQPVEQACCNQLRS